MPYVTAAEVQAELGNVIQPTPTVLERYVAEIETRAKKKIGDPLPENHQVLKGAILDYATARAREKAYQNQSRDLYLSARQLKLDAEKLIEEIDVQENRPGEDKSTESYSAVFYTGRLR